MAAAPRRSCAGHAATCSIMFSSALPSPSAISRSRARAAASSGSSRPISLSARCAIASRSSADSLSRTSTWARLSSAEFSSKLGFSVVAPTRTIVPSSMCGRKPSCWALLKRWISSTKSSVPDPLPRRIRASSKTRRRSWTPVKMALICTKRSSVPSASSRAIVVLPTPGGPHRMRDPRVFAASIAPSGPSGASRLRWPTTSSRLRGRSRSASGPRPCASCAPSVSPPKRSVMATGRS